MICSFLNIIQSHPETSIQTMGIPLVSGANAQYFELSEGIVLLQEWDVNEYQIVHLNCQYQRPFVFEWQEPESASIFICCLTFVDIFAILHLLRKQTFFKSNLEKLVFSLLFMVTHIIAEHTFFPSNVMVDQLDPLKC